MTENVKPFLVRLTTENVDRLNKAKEDMELPKATIINQAIEEYLTKDLNSRLNKIL
jgi:predicted DNA-binding protein